MSEQDKGKITQEFLDATASLLDLQKRASKPGVDVLLMQARDRLSKARLRARTSLNRAEYEQLVKESD